MAGPTPQTLSRARWLQLIAGIIGMSLIANLQYGWTLFVEPMRQAHHWGRPEIAFAFTLFVLVETWLVPVEAYLVDRFGPSWVVLAGGLLAGLSWVIDAHAATLPVLYAGSIISGVGAGAVYGTCIGNALKWFPDRRGFAAGLTAMGFGAGSALTIQPLASMIHSQGYAATFQNFGIAQGAGLIVLALLLRRAPANARLDVRSPARQQALARGSVDPGRMLLTPVFWVMYVMFVLMASTGLMITAQLASIAKDFNVDQVPVALLGLTLPALSLTVSIDQVSNGVARPFFGWVSDQIGRELTMFIAFALAGTGFLLLGKLGHNPLAFVILSAMVFFSWGEIYSLFPATCGDTFGPRFAATNAGLLYTAKGTASLLVPLTALLSAWGGWPAVFWVASFFNFVAAVAALAVLKPLRANFAATSPAVEALPADT